MSTPQRCTLSPLPVAIALPVVRDLFLVPLHVGVQFLDPFQQLPRWLILGVERRRFHIHLQTLERIQCLEHIAVPQVPLDGERLKPGEIIGLTRRNTTLNW